MRRSRSPLTAWPAFADLMTVLAVLGLAIAAGVASVDAPAPPPEDRVGSLKAELATARERIASLEAELAGAREVNAGLRAGLDEAERSLDEAERREIERRLGSVPCLGTRPGSPTAPVPLLSIVVDAGYRLTRLWPPENAADVAGIPRLQEAIARGRMPEADFSRYARGMHAHGNADDTYGGSCRFWVELRKGETASQTAFAQALGVVNQYFLLINSSEVNRILREAE